MATLQNIGKLKYRGKDGLWHPLPVVVQDTGGGVSTISGKGAPTSETQGEVNQLYRDEDTQKLYICTATDGGYTWAEVSGGSVDVDATLTKAGQAADAKAAGDAIGKKIDKAQGTGNAGKILGIGADGNVTPQDKPVQALAGASAPTTATAGVVGQEYYVIVGNAVTEMYVCTAVANGTYTWGKVEFGAEETDPTVPAWAKEAQKPSYTASEVGADPSGTAASQVSAHNTGTDTHSDIRLLISGLTERLNALADSDDTTLDQLSEIVAYIKSNKSLIDEITTKYLPLSGGTMTGKIVFPAGNQNIGITNDRDIKIVGYSNDYFRFGDISYPMQMRGSGANPLYGEKLVLLEGDVYSKGEVDAALGSYIADVAAMVGGDA